jgi:hypothetical protein
VKAAVTASQIRIASIGVRQMADQNSGKTRR